MKTRKCFIWQKYLNTYRGGSCALLVEVGDAKSNHMFFFSIYLESIPKVPEISSSMWGFEISMSFQCLAEKSLF